MFISFFLFLKEAYDLPMEEPFLFLILSNHKDPKRDLETKIGVMRYVAKRLHRNESQGKIKCNYL